MHRKQPKAPPAQERMIESYRHWNLWGFYDMHGNVGRIGVDCRPYAGRRMADGLLRAPFHADNWSDVHGQGRRVFEVNTATALTGLSLLAEEAQPETEEQEGQWNNWRLTISGGFGRGSMKTT